jgi:hypothetical protein
MGYSITSSARPNARDFAERAAIGASGIGWAEGRNLRIDERWAGADTALLSAYAQEVIGLRPT